jgi:hypothetical protein
MATEITSKIAKDSQELKGNLQRVYRMSKQTIPLYRIKCYNK